MLLTNRNAYEERILRETQAFVYTLNSEVQTEYIRSNSHFLDVLVSGGKAEALGRTYNVLGLDATRKRIEQVEAGLPPDEPCAQAARLGHGLRGPGLGRARPRPPGAGGDGASDRPRPAFHARPFVSPGIAGAELRPGHLAGLRDAAARRGRADARARRERARAPPARGRAPGSARGREGRAVRDRRLRARPAARARLRRSRPRSRRRAPPGRASRCWSSRSRPPAPRSARSAASSAPPRAICAPPRSSASPSSRRSCWSASCRARSRHSLPASRSSCRSLPRFARSVRRCSTPRRSRRCSAASAHLLLLTAVLARRVGRALQALSELTTTPQRLGRQSHDAPVELERFDP